MLGQGVMPRHHHHMGALLGDERLRRALDSLKHNIARGVAGLPGHEEFVCIWFLREQRHLQRSRAAQ
jgi:tryptophan halogenase